MEVQTGCLRLLRSCCIVFLSLNYADFHYKKLNLGSHPLKQVRICQKKLEFHPCHLNINFKRNEEIDFLSLPLKTLTD